jgi:hypothetical protein
MSNYMPYPSVASIFLNFSNKLVYLTISSVICYGSVVFDLNPFDLCPLFHNNTKVQIKSLIYIGRKKVEERERFYIIEDRVKEM